MFDPSIPFTGVKHVDPDVIQSIVASVEFDYAEQSAVLTAYEICSDFTLNSICCYMQNDDSMSYGSE